MNHSHIASRLIFRVLALASCLSINVHALGADPTDLPDWLKISFEKPSFFSDVYKHSIAQGIFLRMSKKTFLPPVQYLTRPVKGTIETESEQIAQTILKNLSINVKALSTFKRRGGPIKAGEKHNLEGTFVEYQSNDVSGESEITCMIFVKNKETLYVAYTRAFLSALPRCSEELKVLANSPTLFN